MFQDRIVVECNENGFEPEHVRAICEIGQSSKVKGGPDSQGYIGQKGIGFKSVFKVARRVDIHSGDYSFYFETRPDDGPVEAGLAMTCPIWMEPEEELPGPLTRMTLWLRQDGDPDALLSMQRNIKQQFAALRESLLLFLKNLAEINIAIYDKEGNLEKSIRFNKSGSKPSRVTLAKTEEENGKVDTASTIYHVLEHTAGNLPRSELRNYSEYEERKKSYAQAKVTLAFPLTAEETPIINNQDVFTFLPMRYEGFSVRVPPCMLLCT